MRDVGKYLQSAVHYCRQQITLAPLAMSALKNNPVMYNDGELFTPGHHGYKQYAVILKKQKEFDKLAELLAKKKSEGWA